MGGRVGAKCQHVSSGLVVGIMVGRVLLERQVQNAECSFFRCFNRVPDSIVSFALVISMPSTFCIAHVAHMMT